MEITIQLNKIPKVVDFRSKPSLELTKARRTGRLAVNKNAVDNSVNVAQYTIKGALFLLTFDRMTSLAGKPQQHLFQQVPVQELDLGLCRQGLSGLRVVDRVPQLAGTLLAEVAQPKVVARALVLHPMPHLLREVIREGTQQVGRQDNPVLTKHGENIGNKGFDAFHYSAMVENGARGGSRTPTCTLEACRSAAKLPKQ